MSKKYCNKCEKEVESEENICPICGSELTEVELNAEEETPKDVNQSNDEEYVICATCGAQNKVGAKFCVKCGNDVNVKLCPKCGTQNKKEASFCKNCGFNLNYFQRSPKPGAIYGIYGIGGRYMEVYEDRVVIVTRLAIESLIFGNATDGEKTIYYVDCNGIQVKQTGIAYGYIQLETASSLMNNLKSNYFNENSFAYDLTAITPDNINEVVNYIKNRIHEIKTNKGKPIMQTISPADEIKKYKELLDMGAITAEEYEKKKNELLNS